MKVLELFAGSRSIGKAFERDGAEVFSVDIEPFDNIDLVKDILDVQVKDIPFVPDVIWASPPCTAFSVAAIGRNWVSGEVFKPKTDKAELGIKILNKTIDLIMDFTLLNNDVIWYIENPRGKMRKSPRWDSVYNIRHTVTYCQYGDSRMKPTDIWTSNWLWNPRPMCKNGDPCHTPAPRGKIPTQLCEEIVKTSKEKRHESIKFV